MTDNTSEDNIITNRSEIALVIDAKDTNPNGDPLTADNEPRIDPNTGQCIVTDVRLKRYIRDQIDDDGDAILIKNPDDGVYTREKMYKALSEELEGEPAELSDGKVVEGFLGAATDVRYFGATISIDTDLSDRLPDQFQGPVQFGHGRSYHEVDRNTESKELATVIANDEDSEQGTFATDHRIEYGVIGFGGRINENAADTTHLTDADVKRLDTLIWRALKNQTITRSKVGQQPRLYLRVEYGPDAFEIGRLNDRIDVEPETSVSEMRSVTDYQLDVRKLVTALEEHSGRIDTVYLTADTAVTFGLPDGSSGNRNDFEKSLSSALGQDSVEMYDVYERYTNE